MEIYQSEICLYSPAVCSMAVISLKRNTCVDQMHVKEECNIIIIAI